MASAVSRTGRFSPLLLAALVLVVAFLGVGSKRLLSALYVQYSQELDRSGHGALALSTAQSAESLAPWRIDAYRAAMHAGAGADSARLQASATALRWAPADPYLWAERGRALMMSNYFGSPLADVLRNVHELAPYSPQLHRTNAWYGRIYWHRGNPEVRAYWLQSLRFTIRISPRRYLRAMAKAGYAQELCWGAGQELNLSWWCNRQLRE